VCEDIIQTTLLLEKVKEKEKIKSKIKKKNFCRAASHVEHAARDF
jgi:hypothetical protein